jgi:hypothetical protein
MAMPTTAIPGTSAGAFGYAAAASRIQEGSYTVVIYGLIRSVSGLYWPVFLSRFAGTV